MGLAGTDLLSLGARVRSPRAAQRCLLRTGGCAQPAQPPGPGLLCHTEMLTFVGLGSWMSRAWIQGQVGFGSTRVAVQAPLGAEQLLGGAVGSLWARSILERRGGGCGFPAGRLERPLQLFISRKV